MLASCWIVSFGLQIEMSSKWNGIVCPLSSNFLTSCMALAWYGVDSGDTWTQFPRSWIFRELYVLSSNFWHRGYVLLPIVMVRGFWRDIDGVLPIIYHKMIVDLFGHHLPPKNSRGSRGGYFGHFLERCSLAQIARKHTKSQRNSFYCHGGWRCVFLG